MRSVSSSFVAVSSRSLSSSSLSSSLIPRTVRSNLNQRILIEQQYCALSVLARHRLQRILPRIDHYRTLSTIPTSTSTPLSSASASPSVTASPVIHAPNPSTPSPPNPSSEDTQKKRDGIGSKVLDYFVDHPWHFFGPLFVIILFYILRASKSTDNQDNLVKAIDEVSLLHAREVTTIGRANTLTREQWLQIVDRTFRMVEEFIDNYHHHHHPPGSGSTTTTTIADKLRLLQIRPSELQYIIEQVTGKPLNYSYMLQRGATGLALQRDNLIRIPRNNDEMDKFKEEDNDILTKLYEPWDVLPLNGPIVNKDSPYNDPLVDVLDLLSLYGTILGGRPEPPLPSSPPPSSTGTNENTSSSPPVVPEGPSSPLDVYASPLQRLAIYRSMLYRYNQLKETKLQLPSVYTTVPDTTLLSNDASKNLSIDNSKTFTLFEIIDILDLLDRTHQIPTRSRTGPVTQYPFRRYSLRSMSQGIQETLEDIKVPTVTHDHIKYVQGLIDAHQQYTAYPPRSTTVSSVPTSSSIPVLNPLEVKKLVFASRSVCAWGECYGTN